MVRSNRVVPEYTVGKDVEAEDLDEQHPPREG